MKQSNFPAKRVARQVGAAKRRLAQIPNGPLPEDQIELSMERAALRYNVLLNPVDSRGIRTKIKRVGNRF